MERLKAVAIGAGYFSQYHYEAWQRMPEVHVTALCNHHLERAAPLMNKYGVERHYTDYREMIEVEEPDFVDIITPPESHLEITRFAAERGIHVFCQKPLAPTLAESREIVELTDRAGIRFMVNENFRFQPWHREIRRLLDDGAIGDRLHSLNFRMRTGDGWGEKAYMPRQPYFRTYPRLLVYETGVHFIDTFRFLAGEVREVYAKLRRLNGIIAGEDCGLLLLEFEGGCVGLWDANRYNETTAANPRYTFGDFLVEGDGGCIRLDTGGNIRIQPLGKEEYDHEYDHQDINFAGDCCYTTQMHFIQCLRDDMPFETRGAEYLKTLAVQEAVYESAATGLPVKPEQFST